MRSIRSFSETRTTSTSNALLQRQSQPCVGGVSDQIRQYGKQAIWMLCQTIRPDSDFSFFLFVSTSSTPSSPEALSLEGILEANCKVSPTLVNQHAPPGHQFSRPMINLISPPSHIYLSAVASSCRCTCLSRDGVTLFDGMARTNVEPMGRRTSLLQDLSWLQASWKARMRLPLPLPVPLRFPVAFSQQVHVAADPAYLGIRLMRCTSKPAEASSGSGNCTTPGDRLSFWSSV